MVPLVDTKFVIVPREVKLEAVTPLPKVSLESTEVPLIL
jgi:hypothetical protein